jgi:Mpv17 / PMP22 family
LYFSVFQSTFNLYSWQVYHWDGIRFYLGRAISDPQQTTMLKSSATSILQRYNLCLKSNPLLTKSTTGFVLAGAGDLIAQRIDKSKGGITTKTHDPWRRFFVFAAYGCLWTGPFNHFWFGYLARRFPVSGGLTSVMQKLMIQHLIWNPSINLPIYFTFTGTLLGMSRDEIFLWISRDYWSMLAWLWVIYVPANAYCFLCVPEPLQSVFLAAFSLGWNSFLSWKTTQSSEAQLH